MDTLKTYHSPVYGDGEIIAEYDGEIVVVFTKPPGMVITGKAQILPYVHIKKDEAKDGNEL